MAEKSASELAKKLFTDGYFIVKAVTPHLREDLEAEFLKMPEFKKHYRFDELDAGTNRKYNCGGTAFIGNPSVFHNRTIQRFRTQSAAYLMPIFARFIPLMEKKLGISDLKFARSFDRIQVRPKGCKAEKESWHRDDAPMGDELWTGGFQNCDSTETKFCGLKGTHLFGKTADGRGRGFGKIPPPEHPELNRLLLAQANQEDTDETGLIVIPAGHIIIWISTIIHQVYSAKATSTSVKSYLGFRITKDKESSGYFKTLYKKNKDGRFEEDEIVPLTIKEVRTQIIENDAMTLPSGQIPPMYPKLYFSNPKRFIPIFRRFAEETLIENCMRVPLSKFDEKDKNNKQMPELFVEGGRSMKSLAEMGLPVMEYEETEKNLMVPQRDVKIFNFDTHRTETFSIDYPGARHVPPNVRYELPPPYEKPPGPIKSSNTKKKNGGPPSAKRSRKSSSKSDKSNGASSEREVRHEEDRGQDLYQPFQPYEPQGKPISDRKVSPRELRHYQKIQNELDDILGTSKHEIITVSDSSDENHAQASSSSHLSGRTSPRHEMRTSSDISDVSHKSSDSGYATPDYYTDNEENMARAVQLSMKPWNRKAAYKGLKKRPKGTRRR